MTQRFSGLDFLRAVSMIYIVGFWHLLEYTNAAPWFYHKASLQLVVLAMSIFVAMSGYLMGARTNTEAPAWVRKFIVTRFARLYVPFVGALILFKATKLASFEVVLNGALMTAMFVPPAPPTLWFVDMLLIFYMVGGLLLFHGQRPMTFIMIASSTLALVFLGATVWHVVDGRMLIYLPAFIWGIALARWPVIFNKTPTLAVAGALVAITALLPESTSGHADWYCVFGWLGSHLAIQLTRKESTLYTSSWVQYISHASFFMYLLHRPMLKVLTSLYKPDLGLLQLAYLYLVCLPVIFITARLTQTAYDQFALPRIMRLKWLQASP